MDINIIPNMTPAEVRAAVAAEQARRVTALKFTNQFERGLITTYELADRLAELH